MMIDLTAKLAASQYLSQFDSSAIPSAEEALAQMQYLCEQFEQFATSDAPEQYLIQSKKEFNWAWSCAMLSGAVSQSELGVWQTRFAECSVNYALFLAWQKIISKYSALASLEPHIAGLFVLGMGKLGGGDLNFSSDVDLIAYFDPQQLPVPDVLGKGYVCHQVLQELTRMLGQKGQRQFIWRIDWRLRPNASATSLAMSIEAAQEYYFYQASPWHRLALMKARVIAGDKQTGEQFLHSLAPFIWRQNLDYRSFDELAQIKARINLAHPALRAQRTWREPISEHIAGFNVKLGTGGIREIEFIANALQLVWGGKHHALRVPNTITALQVLGERALLDAQVCEQLIQAYTHLRQIENAIQLRNNLQTHLIPDNQQGQQELCVLLDQVSWSDFVRQLNQHRVVVSELFSELFAERSAQETEPLSWPADLSQDASDIVEMWENGFHHYGVSRAVRTKLIPLTRALANTFVNVQAGDASEQIVRLNGFFKLLPSPEQYLRLLAESPALLSKFLEPLIHSPPMAKLLRQSPHIIDCYVQHQWRYPEQFDFDFVLKTKGYEMKLERLRRFVNEYLYQLYQHFIASELSLSEFQQGLTDLAEQSLQLCLELVSNNMQIDVNPISIIGLGKVALRKMSPLSDLDLIFVYQQNDQHDLANRFVSRLQTAIAAPMREGIAYELDTRLRPSGRAGAPTVSVDSFAKHHLERARSWEHIALVPSRLIAGNTAPSEQIQQIKRHVISAQREPMQFKNDALKMWQRLSEHRIEHQSVEQMHSKLRLGGLMQAEYLAACLILEQGATLDTQSLEFSDLLAQTQAPELAEIIQFWRIQQIYQRLFGLTGKAITAMDVKFQEKLCHDSGVSNLSQLLDKKNSLIDSVEKRTQQFFQDVSLNQEQLAQWQEKNVNWL